MTFKEFYDYLIEVSCRQEGFYKNHEMHTLGSAIHLYDGNKQMDLCLCDPFKDNFKVIYNFIFNTEANQVEVYDVRKGIVDYNHGIVCSMDDSIDVTKPIVRSIIRSATQAMPVMYLTN